ncbi:hypothetical protein Tco_0205640 [Tanacetum coccineum]
MVVQAQAEMGEDNVVDKAVNEEMDDSLERADTTATSLDAEQDKGNINKTQSKATPNKDGSQETTSGGGPRCQETMGDTIAQNRFENVSKTSNDPLLARGNTLRSGKDCLKLNELMELCTTLQQIVLDLETTKTTQANEIASLKRRVKKLERRNKSRTYELKRMYRVGSSRRVESSKDEVNVHTDEDMFGVNDLDGDEVIVDNGDVVKTAKETRSVVEEVIVVIEKAKLVSTAKETVNAASTTVSTASTITVSAATHTTTTTAIITDVEITLAQALAELKSVKPKVVKVVIQEPEQELASKLQAEEEEEEEEERLAREKAHQTEEAKIAWDDVQAKIEADYQLAQRLQAQEQEELTDEEKSSSKRAGDELEQENAKKQKVDEDKEIVDLQSLIEVVPDDEEEVAIDAVPLATKPPTIVDRKIHKEGKKRYYQIIRADGKSQMYRVFSQMLKSFSREDLEDLYKDQVWKNQDNYSILDWKLYDSCGVHSLRKKNVYIHMLVEKRDLLTPSTIADMLNMKLQADHFSEMAYQLLKLLTKQLNNQ